jgi:ankyrin repeat protein
MRKYEVVAVTVALGIMMLPVYDARTLRNSDRRKHQSSLEEEFGQGPLSEEEIVHATHFQAELIEFVDMNAAVDAWFLIEMGIDLNLPLNDQGLTALMYAAYEGQSRAVRRLLVTAGDDYLRLLDARNSKGWTPLMWAVLAQQCELVEVLINAGADLELHSVLNEEDRANRELTGMLPEPHGATALMLAVAYGDIECVRLLIDAGADADARNSRKWTAALIAADANQAGALRILMNTTGFDLDRNLGEGDHVNEVMMAAMKGSEAALRVLIDAGANLDKVVYNLGHTATMLCAGGMNAVEGTGTLQMLIDAGADIDFQHRDYIDCYGEKPHDDADCTDPPPGYGFTAISEAVKYGRMDSLRVLVTAGADLNQRDEEGLTPAMRVAREGTFEMAMVLKAGGAGVVPQYISAHTFRARISQWCASPSHDITNCLVFAPADLSMRTEFEFEDIEAGDMTAAMLARHHSQFKIQDLFEGKKIRREKMRVKNVRHSRARKTH